MSIRDLRRRSSSQTQASSCCKCSPPISTELSGTDVDPRATYTAYLNGTVQPEFSNSIPIPQLGRHHSDLSVVFLIPNGIVFAEKSEDL